ncbi:hypothetical protein NFI96_034271 [Prochilodus magdalenae]|nr:hypothetical protein NFI96_034271 [Prochilodus magdalenae]
MSRPSSRMTRLRKELSRFGELGSKIRLIPLGCKNAALKHVLFFRRQVFMFLNSADKTLEVSFRVPHGHICGRYEQGSGLGLAIGVFEDPGEGTSATLAPGVGRDLGSVGSVDGAPVTSEAVSEVNGGLMMAGLSSEESEAREREVCDSQLSLAVSLEEDMEEDRMSEVSDFGGKKSSHRHESLVSVLRDDGTVTADPAEVRRLAVGFLLQTVYGQYPGSAVFQSPVRGLTSAQIETGTYETLRTLQ